MNLLIIIIIIMLSNLVSQSNTKIRIFLSFYTNKVTTDYTRRSITFSKLISSKSLFFLHYSKVTAGDSTERKIFLGRQQHTKSHGKSSRWKCINHSPFLSEGSTRF